MSFEIADKRVLVTGATGFIGGRVVARLLSQGAHVRALVRNPEKARALVSAGAEVVLGDLSKPENLREVVGGCDAVVHLAGVLNEFKPLEYFRTVNVAGTRALAEAALDSGVKRFLHASSIVVYGPVGRIDERSPRRPAAIPYCLTKAEAQTVVEQLARERGLPVIIVQPSQVYGPGDETWTLGPMRLLKAGLVVLPSHGRALLQPIYVEDLVDGILLALERGRTGESYLLCGARIVTVAEFFSHHARIVGRTWIPSMPAWMVRGIALLMEAIARLTGKTPPFTRNAIHFIADYKSTFSGGKAKAELGFEPHTSLEEGMELVRRHHSLVV
jgi:nucleoside-diphosphate-sugar epimerase